MNNTGPRVRDTCFTNGTYREVSCGNAELKNSTTAAVAPMTDCQKYFQRPGRPLGLRSTTFR